MGDSINEQQPQATAEEKMVWYRRLYNARYLVYAVFLLVCIVAFVPIVHLSFGIKGGIMSIHFWTGMLLCLGAGWLAGFIVAEPIRCWKRAKDRGLTDSPVLCLLAIPFRIITALAFVSIPIGINRVSLSSWILPEWLKHEYSWLPYVIGAIEIFCGMAASVVFWTLGIIVGLATSPRKAQKPAQNTVKPMTTDKEHQYPSL